MTAKRAASRIASLGTMGALVGAISGVWAVPASATTTASVDNYRTGWDQQESGLGPESVVSSDFGNLFNVQLDGQIYAQPITAGNTLIVATDNDKVYGMNPADGTILWTRDLGPAWPVSDIGCGDLAPNMGVTGTPVYDPATNAVYMVSKVNDGVDVKHPSFYMHAIDPATGLDKPNWPVKIQGSPSNYPGVTFDPYYQGQRAGLLLMNGTVYAAFGSECDLGPFRGYVVGVGTGSHAQTTMWTTENAGQYSGGGIWQAGGGLVSDGTNIFLSTGNGISPAAGPGTSPPGALAESVVKLGVNADGSLTPSDFFSPANASTLDLNDMDLGSGGPVALPDSLGNATVPHLMVEQGKDGRVFLLNRDNLGGRAQGPGGTDNALSVLGPYEGVWGHPAVWGGDGGYIYSVGSAGPLRAFKVGQDGTGKPSLSLAGTSQLQQFGYSSGSPVVTSDGTKSGSAVVWVVYSTGSLGGNSELRAYNPIPDSTGTLQLLGTWPIGTAAKFTIPATDSNRVFVGTRDGRILGFGRPATSALGGQATDFGGVPVGSSQTANVTLTATQDVTVTKLALSNSMFALGAGAPTLPVSLSAGTSLTVPVTFSPTAAGATSAILTATATVGGTPGTYGVALTANGTQEGLSASPGTVNFSTGNPIPVGAAQSASLRVNNTGTQDETVQNTTLPSAPFSVTGLPAQGTVIHPGTGIDLTVTYTPTAVGTVTDKVSIATGTGTLTVPVSGTAIAADPQVTIAPNPLDFGPVPVGTTKHLTFSVTNTGNVSVTISKAKAPVGVFSTAAPIGEGIVVGVDSTLTVDMAFTPTAAGPAQASYEITAEDGQGARYVTMTGTGTTTAPTGPLVTRMSGNTRYDTGVTVSQSKWADAGGDSTGRASAQQVVLARGDVFADALAGGPLAAYDKGPLLLTDPHTLTPATEQEIVRVLPKGGTVNILGLTGAVSDTVANRLTQLGYHVNRFGGGDRYATALDIAQRGLGSPAKVVVATGLDYADALAAGPFATGPAATNGVPAAILLTAGTSMDQATATFVHARAVNSTQASPTVFTVGKQAQIASAGVGGFVRAFSGSDRYDTDRQVVAAIAAAGGLTQVGVATGSGFADALTGGALIAADGGALITVPSSLDPATLGLFNSLAAKLTSVDIFGGVQVVSGAEMSGIVTAVGGRTS